MIADAWLSATCGMPCFRVPEAIGAGAQDIAGQLLAAANGGDAFFYLRLPVDDARSLVRLVRSGFMVVDTGLTLEYRPTAAVPAPSVHIPVSPAQPAQYEATLAIAGSAFRYSRFHLDPLFPSELAHRIKRAWIESYCRGTRGSELYVAGRGPEPEGFLAVLQTDGSRTAVIDLIAVAKRSEGQGIGRALVTHFIAQWQDRAECLRVGTQAANVPSLRLYESCGFRTAKANHVLHAHVRNGKIVS
jgi:ribosomal protein S18 acetylase RimI-like enzyme